VVEINTNPARKELRQFAAIWFPLFCAGVGALLFWKVEAVRWAVGVWIAGGALGVTGWIVPALIKPIFVGLQYATYPISWVVSHVLLAVVYYLMVTPLGLVMGVFGHDPMARRKGMTERTYWREREPERDEESYFRRY
jgi:ABC-type uncharacterized transport system permease subunit